LRGILHLVNSEKYQKQAGWAPIEDKAWAATVAIEKVVRWFI
jgi:hypothetical protein